MQPEFEVHNFVSTPREYEAVYVFPENILVKVAIRQSNRAGKASKPLYRWTAGAWAWAPGQSEEADYMQLCHLGADEMVVREIIPHEASAEDWLTAVREDAALLLSRAEVFGRVLAAAQKKGAKR